MSIITELKINLEQELNAYQKFFQGMLQKFGVKSPNQLDDVGKREFFSAIKAGWKKEKKNNK